MARLNLLSPSHFSAASDARNRGGGGTLNSVVAKDYVQLLPSPEMKRPKRGYLGGGRMILNPTASLIKANLKNTRQWLKTKSLPQKKSQWKKKKQPVFLHVQDALAASVWLRQDDRKDSNRRTSATAVPAAASILPGCCQFTINSPQT